MCVGVCWCVCVHTSTDITNKGLEILDCPPSDYQTSPHVTMQISQAFEFPLCICILQAIKDWRWELPRNEATVRGQKTNNMATGRSGMSLCHVSHCFMQAECIKNTEFYRGMQAEYIKNTEFYRGMQAEYIKNTEFYRGMQAEYIKNTEFYRGMQAECIKNTEFYRGMEAECIKFYRGIQ